MLAAQFALLKKELEKRVVALLAQKSALEANLQRVKADALEERQALSAQLLAAVAEKTRLEAELAAIRARL